METQVGAQKDIQLEILGYISSSEKSCKLVD